MSIVHLADGWLLWDSVMINVVLFMLVVRSVAVGWQLWIALLVGGVLFKVAMMDSLSVFDVLFMLVSMIGAWMLLE